MGWVHDHDTQGQHEGYVVGYVPRDWFPSDVVPELHSGWPLAVVPAAAADDRLVRELGTHPLDRGHAIRGILWVGAACDCGWRSPRHRAAQVEWFPNMVERSDELDERMRRLWLEHVAHALG